MKLRFFLVCLCLVSLLLVVPVSALENGADAAADDIESPVSVETSTVEEDGLTVNVTIQNPETASPVDSSEVDPQDLADSETSLSQAYLVSSLNENTASDAGTSTDARSMSQIVKDVFGEYQRKTVTVSQYDSAGELVASSTEYVPGLAGLDWEWLSGVMIFTVFLYAVLRMIGGALRQ